MDMYMLVNTIIFFILLVSLGVYIILRVTWVEAKQIARTLSSPLVNEKQSEPIIGYYKSHHTDFPIVAIKYIDDPDFTKVFIWSHLKGYSYISKMFLDDCIEITPSQYYAMTGTLYYKDVNEAIRKLERG